MRSVDLEHCSNLVQLYFLRKNSRASFLLNLLRVTLYHFSNFDPGDSGFLIFNFFDFSFEKRLAQFNGCERSRNELLLLSFSSLQVAATLTYETMADLAARLMLNQPSHVFDSFLHC